MNKRSDLKNYAPGVYIVTHDKHNRGAQRIMKLEEMDSKEVFPYASMCQDDLDDLASFISCSGYKYFLDTVKVNPSQGSIQWICPSGSDRAKDILYFLSLSKEDRKKEIQKLQDENLKVEESGQYKGEIRDGLGTLKHDWCDKGTKAIKARINYYKRVLKQLEKDLEIHQEKS